MGYIDEKKKRDYCAKEIQECTKILKEYSINKLGFSWKIFWIRIDAHSRRLKAMRMLEQIKRIKNV